MVSNWNFLFQGSTFRGYVSFREVYHGVSRNARYVGVNGIDAPYHGLFEACCPSYRKNMLHASRSKLYPGPPFWLSVLAQQLSFFSHFFLRVKSRPMVQSYNSHCCRPPWPRIPKAWRSGNQCGAWTNRWATSRWGFFRPEHGMCRRFFGRISVGFVGSWWVDWDGQKRHEKD